MEAKELMIGDLINVFGHNGDITASPHWYCRKTTSDWIVDMERRESTNKKLTDLGVQVTFPQIGDTAPIPITPEILEKNGWKLDEEFSGDDPCFVLDLSNEDTNWMRNLYWSNDVLYLGDYHYCDCFFVHLLQHALRLLGKDNHADNFKV